MQLYLYKWILLDLDNLKPAFILIELRGIFPNIVIFAVLYGTVLHKCNVALTRTSRFARDRVVAN